MSDNAPTSADFNALLATLNAMVEQMAHAPKSNAAEHRLEQRVEKRIDQLEIKIDKALGFIGDLSVLKATGAAREQRIIVLEGHVSGLEKQVEGLKTWRSLISSMFVVLVAPLSVFAVTQLIQLVTR